MKKVLVLFSVVLLLLSACGDAGNSKIQDAVRKNLKDPGSAQFKDTVFSADNKRACIVWNAKNSMGGYGDWNIAELKKEGSSWAVNDMKGNKYNCSEVGFKAIDASKKAELEAQLKAIEILQKVKSISSEEAAELGRISGNCGSVVSAYVYYSKGVAEYRIRQSSEMLATYEEGLKKAQAKLEAGDC